jgi:hypothetical protein
MNVSDVQRSHDTDLPVTRFIDRLEDEVTSSKLSTGIESQPLLGRLPVRRLIPQDVHSVMDYGGAAAGVASAIIADSAEAKIAGLALAGTVATVSLMTDYKLSAARVIPIEVHEALDYVYGAANIAAPFVLGYAKRDPLASAIQIATGVSVILASMFTDYRAYRGMKWRRIGARRGEIEPGFQPGRTGASRDGQQSAGFTGTGEDLATPPASPRGGTLPPPL